MLVSTQEFVNTIRQIQKASNEFTDAQVWDIIHQFDHNKDGFIEADEILKVKTKNILSNLSKYFLFQTLEIIGNEKVQISKKHLKEIVDLVRKEHIVQEKEKKFEAKIKQQSIMNSVNHIEKTQNI